MKDERLSKLAKSLVEYSIEAKKGQYISIQASIEAKPLILEVIKAVKNIGAYPYVDISDTDIQREVMLSIDDVYLDKQFIISKQKYSEFDAFIRIYANVNDYATVDVPSDIKLKQAKIMRPISDIMLSKKWVLLMYPTAAEAHKAKMSNEAFFDYVIDVCNVDYSKMKDSFSPLKNLMEKTDKVRIVSPGTDLSFSIKDLPAIPCAGECNIPDGEIYTAPVKDSVNGVISYNTPSPQRGTIFENIVLTFKDGKIVEAICKNKDNIKKLNDIFDTDEGSRYVGEFALGVNPRITNPTCNILFDEKISGSLHFTPGMCYDDCNNTNKSAVHWDLVLIQTPEYGGGEIYFDDVLIRKDGVFVIEELKCLNKENL